MLQNKSQMIRVPLYIGLAILYGFLLLKGPMISPDSGGYISSSIIRSPLYPLFIKFSKLVAGERHFLYATSCMQITLGFAAAIFLKNTFQRFFKTEEWVLAIILVLLLTPYFGFSFIGNNILSEALAYPLYLYALSYLLRVFFDRSNFDIVAFFFTVALLILTRTQFLFMMPLGTLMVIYSHSFGKYLFTRSNKWFLALGLIASILAPNLLERSHNYLAHGRFITAPFVGIQLINLPLYIAQENDETLFADPLEKGVFRDTYKKMRIRKIALADLNKTQPPHLHPASHFEDSYNEICWQSLGPTLAAYGVSDPERINSLTTKMALRLISAHPIDYIIMYVRVFVSGYGWYFGAFLVFLLLSAMMHHSRQRDDISLGTFVFVFLAFMNSALIALVEPMLQRYTIYTNTTLVCWLIIFATFCLSAQKRQHHLMA